MQDFWNKRYSETHFAYGTAPNDFLVAESNRIPPGRVLCLAEGEGRNAVYLARHGYHVTAVDQSTVGLKKATQLAQQHGVAIETIVADLADFEIEPSSWEGIVSIWAHLPPDLRKQVHRQVVSGLKPGGVFILEAYTQRQLETSGRGGPPPAQRDRLMSLSALQAELKGLDLILAHETEREVDEGLYHQGHSAVVQLIATARP